MGYRCEVWRPGGARLLSAVLAFAALVGGVPGRAAADGDTDRIYFVAVALEPELEATAGRIGAAARSSLRDLAGIEWRRADERYLGYPTSAIDRLARGKRRLEDGRRAYLELEFEKAIELLKQAAQDFDAAVAAMEDPTSLGEALLFLGASQVAAGDTAEARKVFYRLQSQLPHIEPDPTVFNPDVVEEYRKAKPKAAPRSIRVESEPAGALVYVDFVARGKTPLVVDGLLGATHRIRVARPGAAPYLQTVRLRGRRRLLTVKAELNDLVPAAELSASVDELAAGSFRRGVPVAVRRVAEHLELDKLGVIRVSYGDDPDHVRVQLVMFDMRSGRPVLRAEGATPRAAGILEGSVQSLVASVLEPSHATDPPRDFRLSTIAPSSGDGVSFEQDEPEDSKSVWKTWWLWTLVGAAVAGGVVAAVLLTRDSGSGGDRSGRVVLEF